MWTGEEVANDLRGRRERVRTSLIVYKNWDERVVFRVRDLTEQRVLGSVSLPSYPNKFE